MKAATVTASGITGVTTISIHAAREGGDVGVIWRFFKCGKISIHAAREGGDAKDGTAAARDPEISIHAAREGGDP